jgi:hypothetical protein
MRSLQYFQMILLGSLAGGTAASRAIADDAQDLSKKLANPVSSLISVPFQYNYDHNIGPADDGHKHYLNIQPVVPVKLNAEWNVVVRTIMPVISQDEIAPGSGNQFGLGDITQSFFFTPRNAPGGFVWALGPAFLYPAGTEELLSTEKWAAGPTALLLQQTGPWSIGVLSNHLWSFAGDDDRADVSSTFIQPFISYTTKDAWTITLNSESTYDWTAEAWSVPVNFLATKLITIGHQPISLGGGVRYWAESPDSGAEGWGARAVLTFLFPTGG